MDSNGSFRSETGPVRASMIFPLCLVAVALAAISPAYAVLCHGVAAARAIAAHRPLAAQSSRSLAHSDRTPELEESLETEFYDAE